MKIQILGTGCAKCKALTEHTERAIGELGLAAEIEKVEGLADIARMGVMMTPALAVDGEVKSSGHLLSVHQVKEILTAEGMER
jgi:small redox-active disulfide protein 2